MEENMKSLDELFAGVKTAAIAYQTGWGLRRLLPCNL